MILDNVALVCLLALGEIVSAYGGNIPPGYEDRAAVCLEVGRAADELELPVEIAVSVALEESRFMRELKSKAGARGPLQIIPRYHCPNPEGAHKPHERRGRLAGCDLVIDGVKALRWFWIEYGEGDWSRGLAHYNSGEKVYPSSRAYARRIMKRAWRWGDQLAGLMKAKVAP